MSNNYTPQPNSLPALVCGFFRNNPDEELTLEDITDKFLATRGNIHTQLSRALEAGLLKRALNDDSEYVYRRGPKLTDVMPCTPAAEPAAKLSKAPPKPAVAKPLTLLPALEDIQIDDNVPIPAVLQRTDAKARAATLTALLGKLQPKQSAALPFGVHYTLSKVVSATHKSGATRYTIRKDKAAQTLRVWRVS